jgi:hypothetical protein
MAQFRAQARSLGFSVVEPPQGVFLSASGHSSLGGGFQIVHDQARQSHGVTEGGGGNGFACVLSPEPGVAHLVNSVG